ncbi:MAG: hypothetical protein M1831_005717 [Alyxoria varia]|nr:MAG: hypothetical protein M1831_005717 [Alyxoria varia]
MASGNTLFRKIGLRQDRPHSISKEPSTDASDTSYADDSLSLGTTRRSLSSNSTATKRSPSPGMPDRVDSITQQQDTLGLHLVYDNVEPAGDIIFVHGLGGTAWRTWCWNRDRKAFWPAWLADKDTLSSYRIFTFGYNSDFKGQETNLSIQDFAKSLLHHMLVFSPEKGQGQSYIGSEHRNITFVAHSMGGLVVKKAFLLGKQDIQFSSIISKVLGIVFLATPHRGSHYAKILSNVLSVSPLGPSPKLYVADLETNSSTIQAINEDFCHVCGELALVSFYETKKTSVGFSKIMAVGKDSAVLHVPNEVSSPLDADHHTACKYRDRSDPNYLLVRNALKYLINSTTINNTVSRYELLSNGESAEVAKQIEEILGVYEPPEHDLRSNRNRIMDGTCRWITWQSDFVNWIMGQGSHRAGLYWLFGKPATGKTTLTTIVTDHLHFLGHQCQYHFFSAGHQAKQTVAYCLRSIATQLAHRHAGFREAIEAFHTKTGIAFTSQSLNANVIWETIFEGILFKVDFEEPLFWVFDAIDEADCSGIFVEMLLKIQSVTPINIFLSSRPMKIPTTSGSMNASVNPYFLSEADTEGDIRTYVTRKIQDSLPEDDAIQTQIIDRILRKASGSFLWARLTLETLEENWHTQDDIQNTLNEVPEGMMALYGRMLQSIKSQPPRTQVLAKRILTWAACSWRPLGLDELRTALEPEFKGFLKLENTVNHICGHFVSIREQKLTLIHTTARQFLLDGKDEEPAFIQSHDAHTHIALSCLRFLSNERWKPLFQPYSVSPTLGISTKRQNYLRLLGDKVPFLGYSTVYWAFHVSKAQSYSDHLNKALQTFFNRFCLSWIEAIALSGNLRYLTRSAQYLKKYAKRRSRKPILDSTEAPLSLHEDESNDSKWIFSWAVDMIRIVGKFGPGLVQSPSSIYRDIPPFCPKDSMIGKIYGESRLGMLSVVGLHSDRWDDCLASVCVGDDMIASKVLATESLYITLVSSIGSIGLWNAETCELLRLIKIGEYVPLMTLNKTGTLLATASYSCYQVWELSSGKCLYCLPKSGDTPRVLAISFGANGSHLIIGLENMTLSCIDLDHGKQVWTRSFELCENEHFGCPDSMALSPDREKIALSWRGRAPVVWQMFGLQTQTERSCRIKSASDPLTAPELLRWLPDSDSLLVLCRDTSIVKWDLYEEEQHIYDHIKPRGMTISHDGNFLLTNDSSGTICVWSFPHLSLVYKLTGNDDFVRDVTFSPDGQRIYDTRASMCNIWEPDALVRADEQDLEDQSSMSGARSISTEPAISTTRTACPCVTALASGSNDSYYSCGSDNGSVTIHSTKDGRKLRKVYSHSAYSSVLSLYWSNSGRFMVSGDDSARIIVKRLEMKELDKWAVFPVLDFQLDEPVEHFICSSDELHLLVATPTKYRLFNLKSKSEVTVLRREGHQVSIQQDHYRGDLVCFLEPTKILLRRWCDLHEVGVIHLSDTLEKPKTEELKQEQQVSWTATIDALDLLVFATLPKVDTLSATRCLSHHGLRIKSVRTGVLSTSSTSTQVYDYDRTFIPHIKRFIGILEDRIVFLDHDYWICTWSLSSADGGSQKHFFLPKDWLNTTSLQMARVNGDGTFFCPKNENVAIVKNGIRL